MVNPKVDGQSEGKLSASSNSGGRDNEASTAFWTGLVAMRNSRKNKPAVPESTAQLSEHASAADFDITHLRRLASRV